MLLFGAITQRLIAAQRANYVFEPTAVSGCVFNQLLSRGGGLTRR
jgi:hypothetical protein